MYSYRTSVSDHFNSNCEQNKCYNGNLLKCYVCVKLVLTQSISGDKKLIFATVILDNGYSEVVVVLCLFSVVGFVVVFCVVLLLFFVFF